MSRGEPRELATAHSFYLDKLMKASTQTPTPAHYLALDGLRGVAALVVVWYHIFEAFATSPLDQIVNHGYLAVDFFFLLSGFVVSYAYDKRWQTMSLGQFVRRRLIRLHPMVIVGALLGGLLFYTQSPPWNDLSLVPLGMLLLSVLMNMLLVPSPASLDVRGYTEIFPLNGPTWSLFFEYIGNLWYALVLRHLKERVLTWLCCALFLWLCYEVLVHSPWGYAGAGWSFADGGFFGGLIRVLFSFTLGVAISRSFNPSNKLPRAFWLCAISLVALLVMPRLGGERTMWINGVYELVCIALIFPIILRLAASETNPGPKMTRLYRWLGDISYPLYIVHFPFVYLYIAVVKRHELDFLSSLPMALLLFFGSIALAHLLLRFYDLPIRKKLEKYALR